MNRRPPIASSLLAAALVAMLAGCAPAKGTDDAATVTVDSSATACTVSTDSVPSGTTVFTVGNSADQVTEFYLLAADGKKVVAEVEDVTPGVSRKLSVELQAGDYFTLCKPGMTGDGVGKAPFTVTEAD